MDTSHECSDCKHFRYEGEYYVDDDWFTDLICEKGHYDIVGFGAKACCDFEKENDR